MSKRIKGAACGAFATGLLIAGCDGSSTDRPTPSQRPSPGAASSPVTEYQMAAAWCRRHGPGVYPNFGASVELRCDADGERYLRQKNGGPWVKVPHPATPLGTPGL